MRTAVIRFYGRRKGESLLLTLSSVQDDGLLFQRGKNRQGQPKKPILHLWDPRLRKMMARLLRWRAEVYRSGKPTTMLVLNRDGGPMTETGFNSAWRRAMGRAGVKGEFTFHDLRAARASTLSQDDAPERKRGAIVVDLLKKNVQASEVLAHDNDATTRRVYRRGTQVKGAK